MTDDAQARASRDAALAAKRRLSPVLLALEGVTGLGVQGDEVVVYVTDESADVRERIVRALRDRGEAPRWRCEATGGFKAR
jgi:hypothetical protein